MSVLSAGLGLVGGFIQAQGAMQQAEAIAKAHEFNAEVADRNKDIIREQTWATIGDKNRENMRTVAAVRGKFAANGISATGSAADVVMDVHKELDLGLRRISYQGHIMAMEQADAATLERMGADAAMQAGQISATAAILGGITSFVGAMGSMSGGGFGGGGGSTFSGGGYSTGFTNTENVTMPLPTARPTMMPLPVPRPGSTAPYYDWPI